VSAVDPSSEPALDPDAPSVYYDGTDEVWVYRASAIGGCMKALVYGRMGMEGQPPPEWLQERFDEGHYHEAPILARFEDDQGYSLFGEQMVVEIKVKPGVVVRGHIDAYTHLATGKCVVDAKAVTENTFKVLEKGGMAEYDWQQSAYCAALEADQFCLACGIKDRDKPLAEQLVEVRYLWDKPRYTISDIRKRILEVERHAKNGTLPDCTDMYPCPFFHLHDDDEAEPESIELAGIDIQVLDKAHGFYARRKELEAEVNDLKTKERELIDALVKKHGARFHGPKLKVTRTADIEVPEQTKTTKAHTRKGYAKYTEV